MAVTSAQVDEGAVAFEDFYEAYTERLYSYLRRIGARHSDAQDCMQDAMVETWRRWPTLDGERHAANYLFVSARNRFIDRTRKARREALSHPALHEAVATSPCPERMAELAAMRQGIATSLRKLPPRDRALVVDAELNDLPSEELAFRYEMTTNALRQRRFRSRQFLRGELWDWLHAPVPVAASLARRLTQPLHAVQRWWNEVTVAVGSQSVAIMVVALSVVIGSWGSPARLDRPRDVLRRAADVTSASMSQPQALAIRSRAGSGSAPRQHLAATTARQRSGSHTLKPTVPTVCVDHACPLGGAPGDGSDVMTVHVPAPVGDREVRESAVAVCWAPDVPAMDCHTDGDPHYGVPPPPPPRGTT